MKKNFLFLSLLACLLLASCGGEEKKSSNPSAAADPDAESAEVVKDGNVTYRPDTALVYTDAKADANSEFIVISKKELRLYVYGTIKGDTTLLARYPVCLSRNKGQKEGSGDMKTPESEPGEPFEITEIVDATTWEHDFEDGRGMIKAYGDWFMRLRTPFKGIGIHGSTNNENKMPGRDSEGCIRLRDGDLVHMKEHYARVGMKVIIKAENQGRLPFEDKAKKNDGHKIG